MKKFRLASVSIALAFSLFLSGCAEKVIYVQPDMPILKEYKVQKLDGIDYEVREKK